MPQRKGLVAPQNRFLDTIATRFHGTHSNFVLGNAQVRDYPIVYCSDGLIELTQFNRSQIMSRCCSCSFLWGEKTTTEKRQAILDALDEKQELQIEVFFQKRSGESFLCLMDIVPIKNDKSQVVLFLVSHKDITSEKVKSEAAIRKTNRQGGRTRLSKTTSSKSSLLRSTLHAPPSYLSAGLATTITAATLGTTAFRNNKLLDYLHTNKSQITNFPSVIPVLSNHSGAETHFSQRRKTAPATALRKISAGSDRENMTNNTLNTRSASLMNCAPETTQALLASESDNSSSVSSSESEKKESSDQSTTYKYERRRSRAVLFHLSGRFDQNAKRKTNLKQFQTIPEYKVQDVQASRFIILHFSLFKIVWDWMILLCTFYIAIMVPYNAAFRLDRGSKDLIICDIIVEVLFIVDIFLNFLTTFVSKSGQVVHHIRQIAIHYLKGWFFLDLIAAIPFDVIDTFHDGMRSDVGSWIHLLKLARLLRLARLFQKIERYSQYSTVILGLLMCMFFLIAHWFACGWYWLGREELNVSGIRNYTWLSELGRRMQITNLTNETNGLSERAVYVSSLYFTTTSLTSVGFGNVSPNTVNEKIFSIIAMLIGALMHAAVFGNVTTLIQRMYARRSAYQIKNQDLKDFTRAHHIPKALKQRMLEFFQAMWAINRGIDKEAIMHSFPENIRGDIALHLNRDILSLPLFKSASPGCRKCLAQTIRTRFATPGEYLINQGDVLREIFFVCSGSLEILDSQGTVVGLLGKCDIFGSDIDQYPSLGFSAYDVKSLTYCELQTLTLDSPMQQILEQYPRFREEFALALHEELSFNIREGFDPSAYTNELPAITIHEKRNTDVEDDASQIGSLESISERLDRTPKITIPPILKIENEIRSENKVEQNNNIFNSETVRTPAAQSFNASISSKLVQMSPSYSEPCSVIGNRIVRSNETPLFCKDLEYKQSNDNGPKAAMKHSKSWPECLRSTGPRPIDRQRYSQQFTTKTNGKSTPHQLIQTSTVFFSTGTDMPSSPSPPLPKCLMEFHQDFSQMRIEMQELRQQVDKLIVELQGTNRLSRAPSRYPSEKWVHVEPHYETDACHNSDQESMSTQDEQHTSEDKHGHDHRVVTFQLPSHRSHHKKPRKTESMQYRPSCLRNQTLLSGESVQSCDGDFASASEQNLN